MHKTLITYNGVTDSATGWAKKLGVYPSLILDRIKLGWDMERIMTTPPAPKRENKIDLVGQKFNHLTVVSFYKVIKNRRYWNCICDCGNHTLANTRDLRSSDKRSCGCLVETNHFRKHGKSNTRLYNIYNKMVQRCCSETNKDFKHYGKRGITVCKEWLDKKDGFDNFYNWAMNNGYSEKLTIDRIDNNAGYSPLNCRWADTITQANNKRSCVNITYNGETKTISEWARTINVNPSLIRSRLKNGWSVEKALTVPVNKNLNTRKIIN